MPTNYTHINIRHDTHHEWQRINPTLQMGEIAYVADLDKMKVGDGITPYNELPFHQGHLPQEKIAEINEAISNAEQATTNANEVAESILARANAGEFNGQDGAQGEQGLPGRDGVDGKDGSVLYPSFEIDNNGHLIAIAPTTEAEMTIELTANGHLLLTI